MLSVVGCFSRVSEVLDRSSFKVFVSDSIVCVTLVLIDSTICFGISESNFLREAVSRTIVPSLVWETGSFSMIPSNSSSLTHVVL